MNRIVITFVLLLFGWAAEAQVSDAFGSQPAQAPLANVLFDYLNVAGGQTAANFKPLTQSERKRLYSKSLINPRKAFHFRGLSMKLTG